MDIEDLASGVQAMLLATPSFSSLVSSFPAEDGNVPALFRKRAPQEARTPYVVWHHITTPIDYESCGEVDQYESTIQLDLFGSYQEQIDALLAAIHSHVSFISGPYGDIEVGSVFVTEAGEDTWSEVDTDGDIESPVSRLDLKIHWNSTT